MNRKSKPFLLLCVIVLVTTMFTGCNKKEKNVSDAAITVTTAQARVAGITKSATYSGIVRGKNEAYILPKVSARVTGILVKPGDAVKAGQTLITLDSSDFDAAVKKAEAAVALAQANQRTNELNLQQARDNYQRIKALYDAGGTSLQALEAARNNYEALSAGTVEASVAQAQASLMDVRQQVDNCTIRSPINGVVGTIGVSLGDNTSVAQVAAIVNNGDDLEIELSVGEGEISYIQQGSEVDVNINAIPGARYKGKVESIATVADPGKKTYAVKVGLPNDGRIRSGMFAEVNVDTVHKDGVVCIPVAAVLPKEGFSIAYVVDKDRKARSVTVETGIKNNDYVEITKGIKAGQEVITKGNTLVNEGTLVKVVAGGGK